MFDATVNRYHFVWVTSAKHLHSLKNEIKNEGFEFVSFGFGAQFTFIRRSYLYLTKKHISHAFCSYFYKQNIF
jgi:hypothetical protein